MIHFKFIPLEERIVLDAAAVIAAIAPPPAGTPIIFVDVNSTYNQSYSDVGTAWNKAFSTLQGALDLAANPSHPGADQIWVAEGTYNPTTPLTGTISQSRSFRLNSDVYIYGGFSGEGNESSIIQADPTLYSTILDGNLGGDPGDMIKTDNAWHVMRMTTSCKVLLDGLTIQNGYAWAVGGGNNLDLNGGGILKFLGNGVIPDTSVLTLNHVIMQDNAAYRDGSQTPALLGRARGGAIFFAGFGGKLNVNASLFQDNLAFSDRAPTIDLGASQGGAIWSNLATVVNILDSSFINNRAAVFGAVVIQGNMFESGYVGHSYFKDNVATAERGGALGFLRLSPNSNLTVETSLFEDNSATSTGGAAIYLDGAGENISTATIRESEFIHNSVASGAGGAILSIGLKVNVINSHFIENQASMGGALAVQGLGLLNVSGAPQTDINVEGSMFVNNLATGTPITLLGLPPGYLFPAESSLTGGGAINIAAAHLSVNDSNFVDNTASNGGAISVAAYSTLIAGSLTASGGVLDVTNSHFVNNQATLVNFATSQTSGDGGAILVKGWLFTGLPAYGATLATISNSEFTNNQAAHSGGAIAVENSNASNGSTLGSVTLLGNTLKNNSSSYAGGAVSLANTTSSITGNILYQSNDSLLGDQFWIQSSSVNSYTNPTDIINSLRSQIKKFGLDDIVIV